MKILAASKELANAELYFLTKAPDIKKMSTLKNQRVDMQMWAMYEDQDKDGNPQTVFSLMTAPEGEVYATNSPSFVRCINDILECFAADSVHALKIIPGESKAGREFLTCAFAG